MLHPYVHPGSMLLRSSEVSMPWGDMIHLSNMEMHC